MKRSLAIAEIAFLGIEPAVQTEGEMELRSGVTMRPATPMNIGLLTASMIRGVLEEAVPDLSEDAELSSADFDRMDEALRVFSLTTLDSIFIEEVRERERAAFEAKLEKLDALRHM